MDLSSPHFLGRTSMVYTPGIIKGSHENLSQPTRSHEVLWFLHIVNDCDLTKIGQLKVNVLTIMSSPHTAGL